MKTDESDGDNHVMGANAHRGRQKDSLSAFLIAIIFLMSSKSVIWTGMIVGSTIGGLLPSLWGASPLSMTSIILTAVGGFLGIWLGFRLTH